MSRLIGYPGYEILLPDIVRAENCYLFDAQGRRYVDLEAGVWCTSIGHGHPRVLRALSEQATLIGHTGFNYTCPTVEQAAEEILALLQFQAGRCIFLCSGSEAVEYGVRVLKQLAPEAMLLTMADSYFGAYGAAHRRPADEWFCFDWSPCADCHRAEPCNDHCPHWHSIPHEKIGALVFEPGSSAGWVRFPPEKLIQNLAQAVRERGGLVLVNEVTTGIGRTGSWFGYEHYGLKPDIVVLGKGIGNGYPVSVTALGERVLNRLADQPVPYAQSHQNDPLGAVVARTVVQVIQEEGLIARGRDVGAQLSAEFEKLKDQVPSIREIRARGLLSAVELTDVATATRVQQGLLGHGYLVARRPGLSILRVDPALTIERSDIDAFLEVLGEVLKG